MKALSSQLIDWLDGLMRRTAGRRTLLRHIKIKPEVCDVGPGASLERIPVPALHISGWYDTYLKGSIDGFRKLSERAGDPFAREHQYLVAGPWQHIPWGDRIGTAVFWCPCHHEFAKAKRTNWHLTMVGI